jgi:hypothetical protein
MKLIKKLHNRQIEKLFDLNETLELLNLLKDNNIKHRSKERPWVLMSIKINTLLKWILKKLI